VANLIRNKRLARAILDAAWSEFARQLRYKTVWLGGELVVCERWFPSTKTCSRCGRVAQQMALGTRTFRCGGCGLVMDRDCNATANLAARAEAAELDGARVPDRQAGGRIIHAPGGKALAIASAVAKPAPVNGEPTLRHPLGPRTPEKGGAQLLR
jgi:putative transposase